MSENKIQEQVIRDLIGGDYNENLAHAMKGAVKAIPETSTDMINYLLMQSIAQSLIALNLQLEDLIGYLVNEEN
jgi:hypothetical protein